MPGNIYLLQDNGTLQPLSERRYDSEDLLQGLLGQYPDLLAGDQIDEVAPRRWLLISREMGVPIAQDGSDCLSLDHLFLDQDAVPTLIEVKRSSDSRIRREVVGQMLDYAAHAVAYWSAEGLRARFEAACEAANQDPIEAIAHFLASEPDDRLAVDTFWSQVKTNLQAGKIRLVFVADEIPPELRRVVEFLNRFMDPVEVLAVEIHQYVGRGLKTLVPRVIGQTADLQHKRPLESRQWDEASFFAELEARRGRAEAEVARKILDWSKIHMPAIWWGKGQQSGGFIPGIDHNGLWHQFIEVWTYGSVEIQFQHMQPDPPFDDESRRRELLRRLNEIAGVSLPENSITRRPSIALSRLKDDAALTQFLAALQWAADETMAS